MTSLPDLRRHGYAVEELLGTNPEGGRTTYRAVELATGRAVVIKRFSFARGDATWDGYAAHERELATLARLDHPRIPAYLGDFQTDDGFCLVQAHCPAPPMSARATWTIDELRRLARSALEVLVYLQDRAPPIVHRDLKPENILVDAGGEAHLVDFGLARADRAAATTIAVGTPGFMAPEQLYGQAVGEATDLYGLGVALTCALTGTRSRDVGELVDRAFRIDLTRLPRAVPPELRRWLARMIAPSLDERFPSARDALAALDVAARAPAAAPARAPGDRRSGARGLIALGGLVVAGAAGYAALSPGGAPAPAAPPRPAVAPAAPAEAPPSARAAAPAPPPSDRRPIACHGPMTLTGEITAPDARWAVTAHAGCDLTIRDATIDARHGVQVDGGRVTIEDTVIAATRAIDVLAGDAHVVRSELSCVEHCVNVRGAGALRLERAVVSVAGDGGTGVSVQGGRLTVTDTEVTAGDMAFNAVMGATVRLERSTFRGARAVSAGASTIELDRVRFEGRVWFNPNAVVSGLDRSEIVEAAP